MELHSDNISEMWRIMAKHVLNLGEPVGNTTEVMNVGYCVRYPMYEAVKTASDERNATIVDYLGNEVKLYEEGILDAGIWASEASGFWKKIQNPDGTINSNYGNLIKYRTDTSQEWTQWQWAKFCLVNDEDTRRAVMHVQRTDHQVVGVKDFPCTMYVVFQYRNGALHMTTHMRSQDIWKGLTYDISYFAKIHQDMCEELHCPKGRLYGFVNSLHIYNKDKEKVEACL